MGDIDTSPKHLEKLRWIARRKELAEKERVKAAKEKAKREAASQRRLSRVANQVNTLQTRIKAIEAHPPTPLAVQLLKEMAVSRKVPTSIRVKSAEILLNWGFGEVNVRRRGRPRKATSEGTR